MKAIIRDTPGFANCVFLIGQIQTIIQYDCYVSVLNSRHLVNGARIPYNFFASSHWQVKYYDDDLNTAYVNVSSPIGRDLYVIVTEDPTFQFSFSRLDPITDFVRYSDTDHMTNNLIYFKITFTSIFALGDTNISTDTLGYNYFMIFNQDIDQNAGNQYAYPTSLPTSETIILK